MAELRQNQIVERLNAEFTGDMRKLLFWYDDNGEFAEDVASMELDNAKIYYLKRDNQFYTKYFLERLDTATNYLIYAPFPKPDVEDNHLEDTLLYSKRFYADRASLLCADLGIEERYKPVVERYLKYFQEQGRVRRFYDLEIERYNEETILVGIMSAICRLKICSFEEVVRVVLTGGQLTDNPFLSEIERYDLLSPFWNLCERQFGYTDDTPTLGRFVAALFVTYTDRQLHCDVPAAWKSFVSRKSGNMIAFMDSLRNNLLYRQRCDELSEEIASALDVPAVLDTLSPGDIADCDTFSAVDGILIRWMTERLVSEDTGAQLNEKRIPEICEGRTKTHYAEQNRAAYALLQAAYRLVTVANYACPDDLKAIAEQYRQQDCLLDQAYRRFCFCYDQVKERDALEPLRTLVENIYANEYLSVLLPKWNQAIQKENAMSVLPLQRNFYRHDLQCAKDRIVVIISDAMRYEVGRELFLRLSDDPRCSVKLDMRLSVLPSITRLGMAALLPHETLTITEDYKILADGIFCDDLAGREKVLRKYNANSRCVQYDEIKNLNSMELRKLIAGNHIVYVYHNQIDARGDEARTEDEVFAACAEAIEEIFTLIHALSSRANTRHCIVTADHGFLYRRSHIAESDKIDAADIRQGASFVNRRFVVSNTPVTGAGIASLPMSRFLGREDNRIISFPIGATVWKLSGGGQNFVHGGSSPQEMLIPILDVKTEKASVACTKARIVLLSIIRKMTSLAVTLEFMQPEAVSDTVKAATYRIFFMSEERERISNENIHVADSREKNPMNRMFRLRFTFRNQEYDRNRQYYLAAFDEAGEEIFRHPVWMDLTFTDDSGFEGRSFWE